MAGFFIGLFLMGKHWGITGEYPSVLSVQTDHKKQNQNYCPTSLKEFVTIVNGKVELVS